MAQRGAGSGFRSLAVALAVRGTSVACSRLPGSPCRDDDEEAQRWEFTTKPRPRFILHAGSLRLRGSKTDSLGFCAATSQVDDAQHSRVRNFNHTVVISTLPEVFRA